MPGIIGYYGNTSFDDDKNYLTRMSRALEADDAFQVDLFQENDIGLGRVSLGVVNPDTQPIWNEDKSICLVMEGELYDYQGLKRSLIEQGHQFKINNDAEFVVHLYEEYGDDFIVHLNGSFVLAIWDQQTKKLLIANDRIGQFPLYYSKVSGRFLFASGVRALLADQSLPRTVDHIAIAQFLTFNHMLDERTLLEGVRRLPPASLIIVQDSRFDIRPYWSMQHPREYELCSEQEWMETLLYYMKQAVMRQAQGEQPLGLLLSGGLDYRIIMAYLCTGEAGRQVNTFTWGIPGCDDATYARELARKMGVTNYFFELKPDWLLHNAEEGVRITDGMGNVIALHAMAALEEESKYARILYKGFMGDGMMGYSLQYQHWADYDDATRIKAHYQVHSGQGAIIFDLPELGQLFTDEFSSYIGDAVFDSYRDAMNSTDSTLLADQRNVYGLRQRVPRMALNGVEVCRQRAFVRLPFCDNDLVAFSLRVPPGLRYERRLIKNAFVRAFPELAQIPVTDTGFPMMDCARDVMMRVDNILRWHLRKAGLSRVTYPKKRLYQDYNAWFRTVLRGWMEENLLSTEMVDSGYFNPDYIQNLVAEHMAGQNHAVRIGALLSIALWHKQFMG